MNLDVWALNSKGKFDELESDSGVLMRTCSKLLKSERYSKQVQIFQDWKKAIETAKQ